jgi:hypothetical protein
MHTNADMRGKKIWLQLKQSLQVLHDILMCTMIDEEVQGGLFPFHLSFCEDITVDEDIQGS